MSETNAVVEKSLRSVFVGNIPYEATEEKLREIFGQAGPVLSFKLMYDRETGNPKGYGFCEYKDQETALSSMRNLNGYEIGGRPLRVDNACTEKSRMEMQSLMMGPVVESPYGAEVDPDKAPEAISNAVASLPPEQMYELMRQMKLCVRNNPSDARTLLTNSPQLAYALLQAQVVMRIIDAKSALQILHPESDATEPLLPSPAQLPPPAASATSGPPPTMNGAPPMNPPVQTNTAAPPPPMPSSMHPRFPLPPGAPMAGPPMMPPNMQQVPVPPPNMFPGPSQPPHPVPPPRDNFPSGDFDLRDHSMQRPPPSSLSNDQDMRRPPVRNAPPPMDNFKAEFDPRFARDFDQREQRYRDNGPAERETFNQDPRDSMRERDPRGTRDPRGMDRDRDYRGGPPEMRDPRDRRPYPAPDKDFRAGPPPTSAPPTLGGMQVPNPVRSQPPPVIPGNMPTGAGGQDQEKANLIMQVLKLSDEQIRILPPDQQASIMKLKQQIQRSSQ